MKHTINKMDRRYPDKNYPMSHTCFFTLDLPAYSSEEVCRERLLYAIHNCQDIDADETSRARMAENRLYVCLNNESEKGWKATIIVTKREKTH